jgi:DNA helicase-2/ATP-dependent DNA helicase PcrA
VRVASIDTPTADRLGAAWRERRSVVIELVPGLGLDEPGHPPPAKISGLQPWEWSPDLDLVAERLHHAVWANAYDGRGQGLEWRWAAEATRLGGRVSTRSPHADLPAHVDLPADVELPDGTPVLYDGGPLDAGLPARAGMGVVHRIWLDHAALRPLGPNSAEGADLAPDQRRAVTEPGLGARVIAPAGSGKTRVLTARARLLLTEWGLPPEALALVAYNVRAAAEMKERLADVGGVRVRTLNALGLRLCGRRATIEATEIRRILSDLVALPRRAETDPAAPWIEALNRVRLGLVAPEVVEAELPDVSDLERVARAFRAELAERDVVDFDEQVVVAIERLLADPPFRHRSQRFARVLLVDEFQDLTPAHLLLLRLLAGPAGAVFGVGDDDQTIYGYAGATPRWLVDFEQWFPGSASHSLEVNYRCPPAVVTAASHLLTRNAVRVPKLIRAGSGGGDLAVLDGPGGPARRSAGRVQSLIDQGAEPTEIAVLVRVNASLVPVHVLLRHAGVPVSSPLDRLFLQRGGVRAALAWLAVATAPSSSLPGAMLREAARRPKRGMSASLLDLVAKQRSVAALERLGDWLDGKGSAREADKVRWLCEDVGQVRAGAGATTGDILSLVRSKVGDGGLDASAAALDRWSHGAIAAHTDDLDALMELADLEPDPSRFGAWLADQLSSAGPGSKDGVTLASIHAVKGREWPHVIIHHATAGLMPHRLSVDLEEERRVFHVGLTRGRSTVSVVPGSPPSPYLREMAAPGEPPVRAAGPPPGRVASGPGRPGSTPGQAAELLPASVGLVFKWRGHEHEAVEVLDGGVRASIAGGPATTSVPFGTVVTVAGRPAHLAHPAGEAAWERLRAWRADRSRSLGKPAFVVFDDKTLRAVAAALPVREQDLLAIGGIGPVKLEAYGPDLVAIGEAVRAGR